MNWIEAVLAMKKGKRVKKLSWNKDEYLCIINGELLDDGGNDFRDRLTIRDFLYTKWTVNND